MTNAKQLWPTLKRLLAYGSPWRKSLILGVVMLWVAAAAEVAGPALVSYFIDHLVAKGNIPLALAGGLAAVYILLQLFAALLHIFTLSFYFSRRVSRYFPAQLLLRFICGTAFALYLS